MKRSLLAVVAASTLWGCGGNVAVALEPEGTGDVIAQDSNALSNDGAPKARSIVVTVAEVSAHVVDKHGDDRDEDETKGWKTIMTGPREVDLLAIPIDGGEVLGDVSLPEGKITQLRMKLASNGERNGERVEVGAVHEPDGTACDLIVPSSAYEVGLKINEVFKAMDIDEVHQTLVVGFDVREVTREKHADGCVWRLNPVLKLKRVERG